MKVNPIEISPTTFACPKCGKQFFNKNAVRMHHVRVHTPAGRKGALKGSRNAQINRDSFLARKRAYNAKVRARYVAQGLTTTGKPRKRPAPKPKFGSTWTPERRKRFQATWEAKKNGVKMAEIARINVQPTKREEVEDPRAFINNCPYCGYNLVPHFLAAKAAHKYVK
jgi:predicted RNA-binding Zn-ribbon protein involved in translation (DUF1610 family)